MRKPVLAICEHRRCRSACASAGRFESYLIRNPRDRFSHDEAHIFLGAALSEFTTNRSVDAKAMCDLAFYNYVEVQWNR